MSECLYEFREPGVAVITFNRPERLNAWTGRMGNEYFSHIDTAVADPMVRVIVVTGAGKGYCAGADMGTLQAIPSGERTQAPRADSGGGIVEGRMQDEITRIPKPVISAVNGAAAGLGMVQALMCDMRFAADTAKFTVAFSKRGLIGEYGISWVLPRLVGQANALDLMMSSRVVLADEALAMGMVNRVVPAALLMDEVMAYAADLAMNVSPSSMSVMKRQVYGDYGKDVSSASRDALRLMQESFTRSDFKEGVQSFLQKRQAEFPPVDPRA
ncbi:MAG: enoyl-CoA hydratase [Actinobacteria bacterium]|nr:enoyl-CoA hydratase [Actinomycetota bacterium]